MFILPIDRIGYFGFQKDVTEADVREMLGIPADESASANTEDPGVSETEAGKTVRHDAPAATPQRETSVSASSQTPLPGKLPTLRNGERVGPAGVNKAALLERLRTRKTSGDSPTRR